MTDEQRVRLEAVPGWSYQAPTEAAWENAFAALTAFAAREGHCRPPHGHREQGVGIHGWSQRQRARQDRGELSENRAALLEQLPRWPRRSTDDVQLLGCGVTFQDPLFRSGDF